MRFMMKLKTMAALSVIAALKVNPAFAGDGKDAAEFHELLRSAVPAEMAGDSTMPLVHMLPDANVIEASNAESVEQAIAALKKSSLALLAKNTASLQKSARKQKSKSLNADTILRRHPLTIVIVPGIFGEFIPTRGFEDVLSQESSDRTAFQAKVGEALAAKDPNATDISFDVNTLKEAAKPLSELVQVGNIKDKAGKPVARVILMYTPFMSLESMGSASDHAEVFNRRLTKYLALTGPQDLAFIGYSRGTVLGLEMLAQAKARNLSWLPQVKGMISLGGVTWGSTLADDTENPNSATARAIAEVKALRANIDPGNAFTTIASWAVFLRNMALMAGQLTNHSLQPKDGELKANPIRSGIDPKSMLELVILGGGKLGIQHPVSDFGNNVRRFQAFLDSVLEGVGTLTTTARLNWWGTHSVPTSVHYYSITGAMANPEASEIDKKAFSTPIGYNNTFDDISLLQNRLDYEGISGITLNDSQVSVAQAMILPNAAAKLNPANAGMNDSFLGTVGTHHWGLALRIVNAMKDGRMNPFPREALLKALAAKVALDQEK